jgi:UDP-N-acetylmuramyl pentapeptide phosphotransferase/UDP-N-acetylglucosamine-1-phosphate transferase
MVKYTGPLPNLADVPLVSKLLMLQGGTILFYILSMTAIANGMNLIDGVNGLCSAVTLSILAGLLFLSYKSKDFAMLSSIFSVMLILAPFVFLNYPYGKIFLGDLGAYSLGLIVSMLTIIFFGRHPEVSPWAALLVLIYPATEVVFSLLRRNIKGVSIWHADKDHLHLKLFYFFKPQPVYKKIANSLVTPILSLLWLYPSMAITWVYHNPFFIWSAVILFIIIYCLLYGILPSDSKKIPRH